MGFIYNMGVCCGKSKPSKPSAPAAKQATSTKQGLQRRLTVVETDFNKGRNSNSVNIDVRSESPLKESRKDAKEAVSGDVATVCGQPSKTRQDSYQDKRLLATGASSSSIALAVRGLAFSCKKGLKPESPNQDDFSIYIEPGCALLSVYDGHGTQGHRISNFVHDALPKLILSDANLKARPIDAISSAFRKVHKSLKQFCAETANRVSCDLSGTTATTLLIQGDKLYVGHVGDSRAVLGWSDQGVYKAKPLTRDHKPNLPEEQARIEAAGGEVKKMPNDIPYRVFKRGEEFPGLAMSRALGDFDAHQFGVIHLAEVSVFKLSQTDEFVILASDGVWEFISDQEAIDIVSKYGRSGVRAASEALAKAAWDYWITNENGEIVDDITVLIAYLPIS
jgi:serine/threonine protein phosphatase PrpC